MVWRNAMMMFTAWVSTIMVALVVGIPILLMFYGLLFNKKRRPSETATAESRSRAASSARGARRR